MDPLEVSVHVNQTIEGTQDAMVDLDGNFFETQVELGLISELKSLVKVIPNVIGQFNVGLVKNYSVEPSYVFPELIHRSANNYVVKSKVLMNYNASWVVYNINVQTVRRALHLPKSNSQQSVSFNENLIISFRQIEIEAKLGFMSTLLNTDQAIEKLTFPYDLQDFKYYVKPFFTLLS